jgi:hypothetical protein
MTNWHNIVDDSTPVPVLDSCSLKDRRRAGPSVKEEKGKHRTKARTFCA